MNQPQSQIDNQRHLIQQAKYLQQQQQLQSVYLFEN